MRCGAMQYTAMESLIVNGLDSGGHQPAVDADAGLSEMDVHTAARHGTATSVERFSQLGTGDDDVRQLRRGVVDATPAHDAAAAGNVDTLSWLLHASPPQSTPMYLSLIHI